MFINMIERKRLPVVIKACHKGVNNCGETQQKSPVTKLSRLNNYSVPVKIFSCVNKTSIEVK